jgi:hypothetical protein
MPRSFVVPLLLASCSLLSAKSYVAERYDVRVLVNPDASLEITETVRFAFSGGAYTFVSREIPARRLDRISDVIASMDGEPAQFEVHDDGRRVRVRWNFHAPPDSSHEFTLVYRVHGAIARLADRDFLDWRVIPERHEYPIRAGEITIQYPEEVLAAPPEASSAVNAVRQDSRAVFTLAALPPDRGASVRVAFRSGFASQPDWQASDAESRARADEAWRTGLVAALLAMVAGLVILVLARSTVPPNAPSNGDPRPGVSEFPPAFGPRLAGGGSTSHAAIATLLDLARRGVVVIRAEARGRFGRKEYVVGSRDRDQSLLPFERIVLDLALPHDAAVAAFSKFASRLAGGAGKFGASVKQRMLSLGLLDPDRLRLRRRWFACGLWLLALGPLVAAAVGGFLSRGAFSSAAWTPQFLGALVGVGIAMALLGLATLILGARISSLSRAGADAAASFAALRSTLSAQARGAPIAADDFERWLPVAVALGLGRRWTRRFRNEGGVFAPEWFSIANEGDVTDFAFFDFVDQGSSFADSAASGGGDGGGGSGGGSSSAG